MLGHIFGDKVTIRDGVTKPFNDSFNMSDEERKFRFEGIVLNHITENEIYEELNQDIDAANRDICGMYAFALYDCKSGRLIVGNDLLSKQSVYFMRCSEGFLFSTSFFEIVREAQAINVELHQDKNAIQHMCKRGVFQYDETYFEEIKFLMPYRYVEYQGSRNEIYIREINEPRQISETSVEEAVDELDRLFYEGCKLQYERNKTISKHQYVTLSGGMDSRMTYYYLSRVMRDCADESPFHTITYAEIGSEDEKIAAQISRDHGNTHSFFDISGGNFIFNRDRNISQNEGMMYYCGTTGAYDAISEFFDAKGSMIHTGLGGGEIMGDILHDAGDLEQGNYYSTKNYESNINDIRTCLNFQKTTSSLCEAFSPFLYEKFFEYAMALPARMKMNRELYRVWYVKMINANYPTTYYRGKVGERKNATLLIRAYNKLKKLFGLKDKYDMNPFYYWYKKNPQIRKYINQTKGNDMLRLDGVLADDVKEVLNDAFQGDVLYKLRVLTATGTLCKLYCVHTN
ncbi:MAG: hypothetical protein RR313_11655 [Anaerovoracaceae bacterium]